MSRRTLPPTLVAVALAVALGTGRADADPEPCLTLGPESPGPVPPRVCLGNQ